MSGGAWYGFLFSLLWPPVAACGWRWFDRHIGRRRRRLFIVDWLVCGAVLLIIMLLTRQWPWAAGYALSTAVALVIWWWRSGKRKKATAALGAKSRALRATLVRKLRESAKPRPVLKPQPQGAS